MAPVPDRPSEALSEEDAAGFRSFGFLVLRQCLGAAEVAALDEAFDRALAGAPRFAQFGQEGTHMLSGFEEEDDAFAGLVGHERIVGAMRELWSRPALFLGSFALLTRGDTPWHTSGTPGEGPEVVRVTVYLDDSTGGDGPLSILAGSHCRDYARVLFQEWGAWENGGARLRLPRDAPGAVEIRTRPGDVVIWLPRTWHAAWKRRDQQPRRGLFLSYLPDPGDDRVLAQKLRRTALAAISSKRPYLYGPKVLASNNLNVTAMVARLRELGASNVTADGDA